MMAMENKHQREKLRKWLDYFSIAIYKKKIKNTVLFFKYNIAVRIGF